MDATQDLSKLTGVSQLTFEKLVNILNSCICHAVFESKLDKETVTEINLGIGHLLISNENNELLFKFIPSSKLEKQLIETLKTNTSPIVEQLEQQLQIKIENVYKEFL